MILYYYSRYLCLHIEGDAHHVSTLCFTVMLYNYTRYLCLHIQGDAQHVSTLCQLHSDTRQGLADCIYSYAAQSGMQARETIKVLDYLAGKDISLYKSTCMSVSLSVCLFPNSSETAKPSELRDDSPWDKEGFKLKNIRIRLTVSRKILGHILL